jgi:hypothetical protein
MDCREQGRTLCFPECNHISTGRSETVTDGLQKVRLPVCTICATPVNVSQSEDVHRFFNDGRSVYASQGDCVTAK